MVSVIINMNVTKLQLKGLPKLPCDLEQEKSRSRSYGKFSVDET